LQPVQLEAVVALLQFCYGSLLHESRDLAKKVELKGSDASQVPDER
jgi:hypothetical protein